MSRAEITRAAARSATGIALGAGASLLGAIIVTTYSVAVVVAALMELGLITVPGEKR